MEIKKGTIAICGSGCLGLITEDEPRVVTYENGNKGIAYVGIHLTDNVAPIGSPWSSKDPKPIIDTYTIQYSYENEQKAHLNVLENYRAMFRELERITQMK